MFHGPSGSGKTTIARILSIAYQCEHQTLWGDPCIDCWRKRSDFAIHEINASDVSGVDELSRVVQQSRYKPINPDGKRVIILDEAQKISNAAQNMLLTPFEEPPASTIWIVCTTEPTKLLLTLRRRCTSYQLKGLGITAAENFLIAQAAKAGITRPLADLFEACHLMQLNAPALLLQSLEKYAAGTSADEAVSGVDGVTIDTLRLCKAVTAGTWKTAIGIMKDAQPDEARWIRASMAGWLRGCLIREASTPGQERAAAGLLDLSNSPFDESSMMPWLLGTLYKICKRYRGGQS